MRVRLSVFLTGAVLMVAYNPCAAQFEGAVWEILTSDSLQHTLGQNPIAATPAGFHITYARSRGPGNGWAIYYRFLNYYGVWDDPVVVLQSNPAFEPTIAAREFDTFRIGIFYDSGGDIYGDIVFSPWQAWEPVNLTNSGSMDYSVTADIDIAGNAHLAWVTQISGEYKIAYGSMGNEGFAMEVLENSELGDFGLGAGPFTLAVDTLPHLFYRGVNGGNYHIHHAYKVSPDSAWEIEFLFTPNVDDYEASAAADSLDDIHLSISGNTGWGMPGHIYYLKRSHQTGDWSVPELVSGSFSVVDGHLGITEDGVVYIAGAGVSGNIYTGDIYLSNNSSGVFEPELLVNYPDGITPALDFLPGPVGALIMQGRISHPGSENQEIIYYGPQETGIESISEAPTSAYALKSYPNPFNAGTRIVIDGIRGLDTRLDIFDILGRKVIELYPLTESRDGLVYRWDGSDGKGITCPSGTYFYSVEIGTRRLSGRMTYLK
jgi:hypothetical protein